MRQFAYVISCYSFRFSPLATFSCPGLILCAVKRPLDPWPAEGLPSYRSSFSFKTLSLENCPWGGQGSPSPSREILSVTARGADRRAQSPRSRGQFRRWRRVCDAQVSSQRKPASRWRSDYWPSGLSITRAINTGGAGSSVRKAGSARRAWSPLREPCGSPSPGSDLTVDTR